MLECPVSTARVENTIHTIPVPKCISKHTRRPGTENQSTLNEKTVGGTGNHLYIVSSKPLELTILILNLRFALTWNDIKQE